LKIEVGSRDPAAFDVVVNATPLGMKDGDPLPMDVDRISPSTFVGEVVMKEEVTPFLAAAQSASKIASYHASRVTGDRYAGEFPRELFRRHGTILIARSLCRVVGFGWFAALLEEQISEEIGRRIPSCDQRRWPGRAL
jgi:hypothetical protein